MNISTRIPTGPYCDSPVHVVAPARLHMGFVDLNGGLGRKFGSLGLTLDSPVTRVHVSKAKGIEAHGPGAERAARLASTMTRSLGLLHGVRVTVGEAIPEHVGLGSGTQLGLAVGMGISKLAGVPLNARQVAHRLDRGARSGIGIGAFELGGFLVDGGQGDTNAPPPVVARADFPDRWRVVLIYDTAFRGKHGEAEKQAFSALPLFPEDAAAHLCRLVLMRLLPGLAETDLDAFGSAITEIQRVVGDHFAAAQGGRFASADVARVLDWLEAEGHRTLGQSSWGPTGFTLVPNLEEAIALVGRLRARFRGDEGLRFEIASGRNCGGEIVPRNPEWGVASGSERARVADRL
ncbi:MAG: GHMP kinase [Thioalkalivibrio sp.]|nr:GHMP kinase [Thioalkalivibrio sp.]